MDTTAALLHVTPETFWMLVKVVLVFAGPLSLAAARRDSDEVRPRILHRRVGLVLDRRVE